MIKIISYIIKHISCFRPCKSRGNTRRTPLKKATSLNCQQHHYVEHMHNDISVKITNIYFCSASVIRDGCDILELQKIKDVTLRSNISIVLV